MRTNASDIADFYHQLALLIRADLPLPESLRQLGKTFPKRGFRDVIFSIGANTAKGEKLSHAMMAYPQYFQAFHIRLIVAGEAVGTLPQTLFAVARFSRFCQLLGTRVRDIVCYPLLTIHMSIVTVLFLGYSVIPKFGLLFDDLFFMTRLPVLTRVVLWMGMLIHNNFLLLCALYFAFIAFSVWLFSPGIRAHRALMNIINVMPGSCRIVESLDTARVCNMCSILLERDMPLHQALETSSQLVDRTRSRNALERASQDIKKGTPMLEALSLGAVDELVLLTFKNTPEGELAAELGLLGELFEHRVTLSLRAASAAWTVLAILLASIIVSITVMAMFLPLISIISVMAA